MRSLLVLPTYNEAENIVEVLERVRSAAPETDVLVVDDASPDGTAEIAERWGCGNGGVRVDRRRGKEGLGSAYRHGFLVALREGYDAVAEMDSDLQHDPASLPALLHVVRDGADLAIGSRYVPGGAVPGWQRSRLWLSKGGNRYASAVLALPVRDSTSGFRVYATASLARLALHRIRADGYGFQIEMAYQVMRNGGRIVEVPITFHDRVRGLSKMSYRIVGEAVVLVSWWGVRDRLVRRIGSALRTRSSPQGASAR